MARFSSIPTLSRLLTGPRIPDLNDTTNFLSAILLKKSNSVDDPDYHWCFELVLVLVHRMGPCELEC